ncbi:MAG: hypothetical protein CMI90_00835 [Pelagibacteraceae bacterium]|nr:hypothetical protein [Pelagibacteraceae bacterium]|tara:strand:- start:2568 stop:2900 length:333 start_codon:yes stop_codon:yes gene_type:complete
MFITKIIVAGIIIAFASWLSGKKPELAGFIIALPITSLIVLVFSYLEHKNVETSITFAKSIAIGVPISYLFFLPFFLSKSFNMNFWLMYFIGILMIFIAYIVHKLIMSFL